MLPNFLLFRRLDEVATIGQVLALRASVDVELRALARRFDLPRQTLRGWWDRFRARSPTLVTGEAGIGKTRLATEFLGWALGHAADVMRGRAFDSDGRLPYQLLVEALRPRLERENAPEDLVADIWLAS